MPILPTSTLSINGLPSPTDPIGRVTISHGDGHWMLNDEPFSLEQKSVVMLGLVRNRIYFGSESHMLLCRSHNGEYGTPTAHFPVSESNFPADAIEKARNEANEYLACGACKFSDWEADPTSPRKSRRPDCVMQLIVPMLIPLGEPGDNRYTLASCSFQRSAEQPITAYMRTFVKSNQPAYSVITYMTLNLNLGNTYRYSVPKFLSTAIVDERIWPALSLLYNTAKVTLQTPPAPIAAREGGMLSVSEPIAATYTGGFFG